MNTGFNFILADDHPLFRKALFRIIEQTGTAKIIFEAKNGVEVIGLLKLHPIDMIFLDYSMPSLNGYDTATIVRKDFPTVRIIVLTQYDEIAVILNFFKLGVQGFLTKNADEKEIHDAITSVSAGNVYYHSRFDESIHKWLSDDLKKNVPAIKFSDRDLELMLLMSKGQTNQEIGKHMGLTKRSVETYRFKLLKNLNINNASELLAYLYRNGIV